MRKKMLKMLLESCVMASEDRLERRVSPKKEISSEVLLFFLPLYLREGWEVGGGP